MSNNYQFMKLGDILVKEKIITQSDLDKALIEQKDTREKLGHVLIKQGSIGEDDLVKAFSLQLGQEHILEEDMFLASEETVRIIPEDFAVQNNVLALNKSGDTLVVAMEDPEDLAVLDSLKELTSLNIDVRVAGSASIKSAIDKHYGKIKQSGEVESAISNISIVKGDEEDGDELDLGTEKVSAEDAPFVKLVNLILNEAIKEDSSDIHIEPGRENVTVRIRVDGVLLQIMTPPMSSLNGMVTRIKILSKLNIAEHRLPQDGRMKIKLIDREYMLFQALMNVSEMINSMKSQQVQTSAYQNQKYQVVVRNNYMVTQQHYNIKEAEVAAAEKAAKAKKKKDAKKKKVSVASMNKMEQLMSMDKLLNM